MANPNKAKGTGWESAVRDYLNLVLGLVDADGRFLDPYDGMNIRRPAQEGSRDVGDVHAAPFILECKATARRAVPSWLRQAEIEAVHAGFPYGAAVEKVPRRHVSAGRVHVSVGMWTRVRLALGLTSRECFERYGFTASTRGLDTGRWYLTTDLESFSALLVDIRAGVRGAVR